MIWKLKKLVYTAVVSASDGLNYFFRIFFFNLINVALSYISLQFYDSEYYILFDNFDIQSCDWVSI